MHNFGTRIIEQKKNTKEQYFNDLLGQYKQDIRKTWGVVNTLIGRTNDKTSISEKFKIQNKITNDANYISNEFCNFKIKIYPQPLYEKQSNPTKIHGANRSL